MKFFKLRRELEELSTHLNHHFFDQGSFPDLHLRSMGIGGVEDGETSRRLIQSGGGAFGGFPELDIVFEGAFGLKGVPVDPVDDFFAEDGVL